jgi:hypothetical protein
MDYVFGDAVGGMAVISACLFTSFIYFFLFERAGCGITAS